MSVTPGAGKGCPRLEYAGNAERGKVNDYQQGSDDTRRELRRLLAKTRDMSPSGRLAVVLSWVGSDLDEVRKLLRKEENEIRCTTEGTD